MSTRRAALVAGAAVIAIAFVPWSANPLYRLAGGPGDGPDPKFDVPFEGVEELRARGATHADTTYFLAPDGASPLAQGNAKAAGQLYLGRNLPVQDPNRAAYVLRLSGQRIEFEPLP